MLHTQPQLNSKTMRNKPSQSRGGNKTLTLHEFLDEMRPRDSSSAVVVAGPRTQGSVDEAWDEDSSLFTGPSGVADASADKQVSVSSLMVAIASEGDPALMFRDNCNAKVHAWFVTDFKRAYQAARVPGKRPWPECAASMRSCFGFVDADLSVISLVAGVHVGTMEHGRLIVTPLLLDKDFATPILDARDSRQTTLGHLCGEVIDALTVEKSGDALDAIQARDPGCKGSRTSSLANGLAMKHGTVPRSMLMSQVAARQAALVQYIADADADKE